jgi:phosphatidylserine/phosphatidylglycerophosphate/cardiolipin synthase-like enzyme
LLQSIIRYLYIALSLLLFAPVLSPAAEVYFSPDGGVRDQIIKRINTSKTFIDVAVYSFTSGDIAEALTNASKRGVKVRVIRDSTQSANQNDENAYLEQNNIQVEIRAGRGRGIMHDKFAVFDGKEAFTGSYNWTNNAEQNNWENALFTDELKVIQAYEKEFEVLWKAPAKQISPRKQHKKRTQTYY